LEERYGFNIIPVGNKDSSSNETGLDPSDSEIPTITERAGNVASAVVDTVRSAGVAVVDKIVDVAKATNEKLEERVKDLGPYETPASAAFSDMDPIAGLPLNAAPRKDASCATEGDEEKKGV